MGAWILVVAFSVAVPLRDDYVTNYMRTGRGVAMQEFGDLQSCQNASIEAQKIAPGIRVVCVPKGSK